MVEHLRVLCVAPESPSLTRTVADHTTHTDGLVCLPATRGEVALAHLEAEPADCLLVTTDLPDMAVESFLERVSTDWPSLPTIVLTDHSKTALDTAAAKQATAMINRAELFEESTADPAAILRDIAGEAAGSDPPSAQPSDFTTLVEASPIPMVVVTRDVELLYANPRTVDFLGSELQSYEGEEAIHFLHPDDRERALAQVREAIDRNEPVEGGEYRVIGPDEQRYYVRGSIVPITYEGTDAALAVFMDITERKRSQEALQASRERLRAQFEHAPDGIVIHDVAGNVIDVNETMASMLGYDRKNLLDMHVSEFEVGFSQDELQELWEEFDSESLITVEGEHRRADGSRFPVEVWVDAIDINGQRRFLAHVRDITERKERERQLEQERNRFSTLFQHFPEPTLIYAYEDEDPIIQNVNQAFVETFGYDAETVVGQRPGDLILPPERADEGWQLNERVKEGRRLDVEIRRQTVDGDRYFVFRNIPMAEPDDIDGFAVYADVHDRKEREQALERKNERLDQFTSIVSHDLRNPLEVATTRLALAREECDSPHLEHVDEAHDRIRTILEETLELARQGEMIDDPQPVAIHDRCPEWWPKIETQDATLEVCDELTVSGDPGRLRQIFENLFHNAVTHGHDGVEVRVGALENDGGFYVEDDGPGLPSGVGSKVFDPTVSTTDDGSGFGLAIVDEIVDAHGWRIEATDGDDGGARFEIYTTDEQP